MTADAPNPSSLDRAAILGSYETNSGDPGEEPERYPEDESFTDLGADSLALIELVEALEEHLATYSAGFHIDDEDLEGLLSVRDAVDYVVAKLQVA